MSHSWLPALVLKHHRGQKEKQKVVQAIGAAKPCLQGQHTGVLTTVHMLALHEQMHGCRQVQSCVQSIAVIWIAAKLRSVQYL